MTVMRKDYKGDDITFDVEGLVSQEPYGMFKHWFDIACSTEGIAEPNAMVLATATRDGRPSARTLLLKGYDNTGFRFFSNYQSRKGQELAENPWASILFYWCNMSAKEGKTWSRQIRIEGKVEPMSEEESTKYFNERPRGSQIGACVSRQSTVIASRQVLDDKQKELEDKFKDESKTIPKPSYWGGYVLQPDRFEFWQGRSNRLHDRIIFRQATVDTKGQPVSVDKTITTIGENGWLIERLSP